MAKLRVELEPNDWQVLMTLVQQGYNDVCQRVASQLNVKPAEAPAPGNGEDRRPDAPSAAQ
jgi:hypothetical protein